MNSEDPWLSVRSAMLIYSTSVCDAGALHLPALTQNIINQTDGMSQSPESYRILFSADV